MLLTFRICYTSRIRAKRRGELDCQTVCRIHIQKKVQNLISKIIKDAKEVGDQYILLDTLPSLESALHMYKKWGFYETGFISKRYYGKTKGV